MSQEAHVTELLPAYSLGCLDEEETASVSEHLEVCELCRAELHAYQSVVGDLALGVPATEPAPELKGRLMERVQPAGPAGRPQPQQPSLTQAWQSLAGFMRRTTPVWGLASLVLILALIAGNLWLWRQVNRPGTSPAGVMQIVTLVGTEVTPDASGIIVISMDGEHGTLVVDGLPTLDDAEQQYQLWLIRDGQRTSGAVFSVNEEGYGSVWVSSPEPLSSYPAFGITIEPAGGSPGPTGDKVLGGDL